MRFYVAGKITGDPDYKDRFLDATLKLVKQGHTVLNPAFLPEGMTPTQYMSLCVPMLLTAEGVYLLDGWDKSPGALIEVQLARYCGKKIYYEWEEEVIADAE